MGRKRFTAEQIINMLREAEVLLNQGSTVGEVCRKLGISEQTYYRWRKDYGGMRVDQAKRLKELEKENVRLKKLVANLSLDNDILKEAARGNF
ncbi:IS3 family transposase ISDsp2 [subsurface metagenome]